jgi:hypothetical protein
MITPEVNDIDISKLFKWSGKFTLVDKYGNMITQEDQPLELNMRLVGDAEVNRAKVFALRKSAELRKKLKDQDTDEHIAFISAIQELDTQAELIDIIGMLKIRDFSEEATKEVRLPFPREPKSDSSLEEREKYQSEVDTYEQRRYDEIHFTIVKKLEIYKKVLAERTLDQLQREYEKLTINQLCEQEMVQKFREYCVYSGTFLDSQFKQRFFTTFEEFENLPTQVKEQVLDHYSTLELSVDELKKSQEAAQ